MKKIQNLSHLAMITLLLVTSCTLKKRLYMTGFQINYKKERLGAYEHQIANKEKFNAYNKIKIELIDHNQYPFFLILILINLKLFYSSLSL